MSQDLRLNEPKHYDDEIDLYELIEILVRHRCTIIITIIVCTLISLGVALYVRANTPDYLVKNILIQQETYGLKGVNRINPDTILLQDSNIERFFEIENLRNDFKSNISENRRDITSKRRYLEELINISKDDKNSNEVTLKVEINTDEDSSRKVVDTYLKILEKQDNLTKVIADEKNLKIVQLSGIKLEMEKVEKEILDIFKTDTSLRELKPEDRVAYMTYKYPALSMKKAELEKYNTVYLNELVRLDNLNDRAEIVRELSDTYFIKGQSKAKLILATGIVFGVFFGIIFAFLKEFIEGYRKRYKS